MINFLNWGFVVSREADYLKCVDLQAECDSLTVGKSIRLTGLIQENDSIGVALLLLNLLVDNKKQILETKEHKNE